jgi:hypothetical protein
MATGQASQPGLTWLAFSLMTVFSWGLYGVLLHTGQMAMGDPVNGRFKAFLFVGIAYLLTAVLAPLVVLVANGASWQMPTRGIAWSLVAGVAGAVGAFCVLLAFGAKGTPAVVMSIVFGGAPNVNALVAVALHPPADGLAGVRWPFVLGILMAATGGYLVTLYRPEAAPPKAAGKVAQAPHGGTQSPLPGTPNSGRSEGGRAP